MDDDGPPRLVRREEIALLKHLNIHEMVGIVASRANDAKRQALFLSIPEITARNRCRT